jgi:excisionase family DNA binding protein
MLLLKRPGIAMRKNRNVESVPNQFFENRILRVAQVAELLGYSKDHIYRLASQKKIPFRKKGKTLFFMSQEILDWVNEGVA